MTAANGSVFGVKTLHARLVLPDGRVTEYGREAMEEHVVARSGDEESWVTRLLGSEGATVKANFLAVPGIVAGAILDIQMTEEQQPAPNWMVYTLQKERFPIRELTFRQYLLDSSDFHPQSILANNKGLQVDWVEDQKKYFVQTTAHNLPPLAAEPFSPPSATAPSRCSAVIPSGWSIFEPEIVPTPIRSTLTPARGRRWPRYFTCLRWTRPTSAGSSGIWSPRSSATPRPKRRKPRGSTVLSPKPISAFCGRSARTPQWCIVPRDRKRWPSSSVFPTS